MFLLNLSKLAELRASALFDIKDEVDKTHPMTCTYLADAKADMMLGSGLANGGGLNSRLSARQIAASDLLWKIGSYHELLFVFDDEIRGFYDCNSEEYLSYFHSFETSELTLIQSLNNYLTYDESLLKPFDLSLIKDNATPIDPNFNETKLYKINFDSTYTPSNAIGKLAIKAAQEVERKSGKLATSKQVIELLQKWATEGSEPAYLMTADANNRTVKWKTEKHYEKNYTTEACGKTLEKWNLGRK